MCERVANSGDSQLDDDMIQLFPRLNNDDINHAQQEFFLAKYSKLHTLHCILSLSLTRAYV